MNEVGKKKSGEDSEFSLHWSKMYLPALFSLLLFSSRSLCQAEYSSRWNYFFSESLS